VPTYQYTCTDCGEPLEAVQSFTDEALTECPVCGGRLRKVFSAVGVVFKGSGFYRTDSRRTGDGRTPAPVGADQGSETQGVEKKERDVKGSEGKGSEGKESEDKGSAGKRSEKKAGEKSTTPSASGSGSAAPKASTPS